MVTLPTQTKYRVIYADPPWKFTSRGHDFVPLSTHYSVQDTAWIKSLPVASIAEEDAALFMWVTDAHKPDAMEVIKAWGFKYVTTAYVWEKVTTTGRPAHTVGAWTIKNVECVFMATRGHMKQYKTSQTERQLIKAVRTQHSRKPEEVRHSIDRLFAEGKRIELFARYWEGRPQHWDYWGDQSGAPL